MICQICSWCETRTLSKPIPSQYVGTYSHQVCYPMMYTMHHVLIGPRSNWCKQFKCHQETLQVEKIAQQSHWNINSNSHSCPRQLSLSSKNFRILHSVICNCRLKLFPCYRTLSWLFEWIFGWRRGSWHCAWDFLLCNRLYFVFWLLSSAWLSWTFCDISSCKNS